MSWNFASSWRKPGAITDTNPGATRMPTAVIRRSIATSLPVIWSRKACVCSAVAVSLYSEKTGTNAWDNAPSPNMRRKKLGTRKATKNASATRPLPMMLAKAISRAKPLILESMVQPPVTAVDLSNLRDINEP